MMVYRDEEAARFACERAAMEALTDARAGHAQAAARVAHLERALARRAAQKRRGSRPRFQTLIGWVVLGVGLALTVSQGALRQDATAAEPAPICSAEPAAPAPPPPRATAPVPPEQLPPQALWKLAFDAVMWPWI
jgi:hypothetical protein